MNWLYKGSYPCAYELNKNGNSQLYLYFIDKMLRVLKINKITPVIVFDGGYLLAKKNTNAIRKQ